MPFVIIYQKDTLYAKANIGCSTARHMLVKLPEFNYKAKQGKITRYL